MAMHKWGITNQIDAVAAKGERFQILVILVDCDFSIKGKVMQHTFSVESIASEFK